MFYLLSYIDVSALPRKSRIHLADRKGCRQHYINANYVDSCDEKRAYSTTNTIKDCLRTHSKMCTACSMQYASHIKMRAQH